MPTLPLPDAVATLHSPLLAYSVVLCRKYGYPEHLAEDFVQEMWARSFRRIDADRTREEAYHYLRSRLVRLFQPKHRARAVNEIWRTPENLYPADMPFAVREAIGTD